jgi:hypothetical protein
MITTKDAVDYFTSAPQYIINRNDTCLVLSIAQLQKLVTSIRFPRAVTYAMDLMHLVELLHEFTEIYQLFIVVKHRDTVVVAVKGSVSTTTTDLNMEELWRVPVASRAAVWWLQNPTLPFEALTSAVHTENKNE